MVYKIEMSARAEKDLYLAADYLLEDWTIHDVENYLSQFERLKKTISQNPYLFQFHNQKKNIRKVPLTKHNLLFYKVDEGNRKVLIITIFNVYQNPNKLGL